MISDLQLIYYTEVSRSLIGFSLLFPELIRLKSSIKQKPTISMIGILIFYNLIFLTRALGIKHQNSAFRQFAPALSALMSAIFLVTWGALVINLDSDKHKIAVVTTALGILVFIIGAIFENPYLSIFGISIFCLTMITIIGQMFLFVFRQSPYLQARYRIFLMTVATVMMIIFEGIGVIAMRAENYYIATIFFGIEVVGRIIMTLSIFLPNKVKNGLSIFIK